MKFRCAEMNSLPLQGKEIYVVGANLSHMLQLHSKEGDGATHHTVIPRYLSGNQTGQFAASYCHPEPEHSRPILKKRQNEQKLK